MNFGELKNDKDLIAKVNKLNNKLDDIETTIDSACNFPNYEVLSTEEKVKFDLFVAYTINSLFWTLTKLQARDPSNPNVRQEIDRVKTAMLREKEIKDRNTIRPIIDTGAAKRFIRHGLWDPKKKKTDKELIGPKPQKRKLEEI